MKKISVNLYKEDYLRALKLAKRFNIAAQAQPAQRVEAVLAQATEFMQQVQGDLKNGNTIYTGSAWHGPDEFLTAQKAVSIATETDDADALNGATRIRIAARDKRALNGLKGAFNLSSDKEAARLALRVFEQVADGLWRGNGFFYDGTNAPKLDTDTIKNRLFPQTP